MYGKTKMFYLCLNHYNKYLVLQYFDRKYIIVNFYRQVKKVHLNINIFMYLFIL